MRTAGLPCESRSDRIGPLAVLPVFVDLHGKRVVIVGASPAAAWKAELVAAAGATVAVFAPRAERSDEMTVLAKTHAVRLIDRHWQPPDLKGAELAIADLPAKDEARRFAEAAVRLNILANVIDQPEFCRIQFGSIVNRSPIVIGISTGGGAPVLGQAIRHKIEMLLPRDLAQWGKRARQIRELVLDRLAPGASRRQFWERFAALAFEPRQLQWDPVTELAAVERGECLAGRLDAIETRGGDPDQLTVRDLKRLQTADAIVLDGEVPPEIVEFARREASRIRPRTCPPGNADDDPGQLARALCAQGKNVVVLRGSRPGQTAPRR